MLRAVIAMLFAAILTTVPDLGSAQYFGRNKVQYRSFDFDIIRTEHFDVYYYESEREAALDAARMVERSYGRLSRILQHEFRDRKPLIVYASHSDFQQTNALSSFIDESTGGVTEALKSRMILPFTGSYADFDHVLTHELVHGFQYDVIFRRGVMTDASPFGPRLPLWFMEGMAEYLSIGTIDPHTQSWLRDASLAGYLRTIEEMMYRDDYLSYRFGQSLWSYIGAKWGDEVVGILLQKAPRTGVERAFASTLGITLEELSIEWTAAVRAQYLPQVADFRRPEAFSAKLTRHEKLEDPWYIAPALSPDGTQMVFLSQEGGFSFDLYLADAKTGEIERKLIESARDGGFESLRYMNSSASFSPDGRYVALAAQTGGRDALYIYDLRSRSVWKKLTYDELNGLSNPGWSPDGRRIVFTGMVGGLSDLFVTNLEGALERLTNDAYADLLPAWSPDGRSIAFTTDRGPDMDLESLSYGNYRVAVMDVESRSVRILPGQDAGKNVNPVWSPDSESLIWVNDMTGTNDLYLYELASNRMSRITDVLSGVIGIGPLSPVLSWSKSGALAFVYFEQAGYNIYRIEDPLELPRMATTGAPVVAEASNGERHGNGNHVMEGDTDVAVAGAEPERASRFDASLYRNNGLFRRSAAAQSVAAEQLAPVSVVDLLDNAAVALPDTGAFVHDDYNVKFTPDLIGRPTIGATVGGYYGNGIYGGSYIALSDMLGNHNILAAANINGSLSDAMFYAGYSFLKTRVNMTAAVSQQPLYRYFGATFMELEVDGQPRDVRAEILLRDIIRSAQAMASYPFSTFRRFELGLNAVHYSSDILYRGFDINTGEYVSKDDPLSGLGYVQPMAALVFDNSLSGWTGPVVGRRYRFQFSRTIGGLQFSEALVDFRNYWNIDQKIVFASRLIGLSRFGDDSNRFSLYWGGPYFLRGYDGGSFRLDSDECVQSRGYGAEESLSRCPVRDQLIGSSAAIMNLEARVPIIKELQIGFLGNFPPVDAVAFFDGGVAWEDSVCIQADFTRSDTCAEALDVKVAWDRKPGEDPYLTREPLFSWGFGLRMNVFYTILRLDYAFPLNRADRSGVFSVSFGPSF